MNKESFFNYERKQLDKFRAMRLPNAYKRLGLVVLILSFVGLFVNKFTADSEMGRSICRYGMLIGLLVISISKEKIEDELISRLREQSYTFSFIVGVIYALVLPLVDYLVDATITAKDPSLNDLGDFAILWLLLSIQVFYFEYLKRIHR